MAGIHRMNLQAIDLNLLLVLEALVEERNVTRAARRIGLSQPAMSNALARLRRTFDDPLLVRNADGMVPTPVAQSLITPVRAALSQLRAALEEKPAFDPSSSERTFHLLTNDYAEIALLAPLAESFDLAIGFYPDALTLDARLRSETLWAEENVCIVSSRHPAIRGKLTLRQYAEAGHVAVFYKAQGPGVIDTLLEQRGYSRKAVMQVPHFASVPFLVSGTDLIATVPVRLARQFSRQLKLQILPVPLSLPQFRLTLLWHERHHTDPAHRWMRNFIIEMAAAIN